MEIGNGLLLQELTASHILEYLILGLNLKNMIQIVNILKHWIPELENVDNKHIHKWYEYYKDYLDSGVKYYKPIVDYKIQREKALNMYKKAL